MKNLKLFLILIELFNLSLSIVPLWEFKNSAINLMSSQNIFEQIVINREISQGISVRFYKRFSKSTTITKRNYLQFYNKAYETIIEKYVTFEDIDYVHIYNATTFFVCPKGKNHLLYIRQSNIENMIPERFNARKEWELKCYYQPEFNQIFVAYLNNEEDIDNIYQFNIDTAQFTKSFYKMGKGLYDFKWTTDKKNYVYPMYAFYRDTNTINLRLYDFTIKEDKFDVSPVKWIEVFSGLKSNYNLYFNSDNSNFYFINYNNINDFQTGYSEEYNLIDESNYQKVKAIINKKSPLEFVDDVVIEEMKFITYTKYVYYKLLNKNKNIFYYGIIDVTLNKVIFNTNEEITLFIPYSKNSMLAINSNNLYKICTIYNYNDCSDKCPEGMKLILDINKQNICSSNYNCQYYILKPDDICINECDLNIFTNNLNKECGLCKDIELNTPYKIINSSICLDEMPDGSEYYNENLKLLKCSNGYNLENDTCISKNCYPNCDECYEPSMNETNQKCLSCKNGYKFLEGNCIDKCPEKYFESNEECFKCNDTCKSCSRSANNCLNCINGYYFKNYNCFKCHPHCKECSDGEIDGNENCISCIDNNTYLISVEGLNRNCVEVCPEKTILDKNKGKCVKPEEKKNDDNNLRKVFLFLAIILLSIIILGIGVYCIRRSIRRKKAGMLIMDDIKKDMPIIN